MGFAAVALLTVFASVQPVMKVLRKGAVELLRDNSYYRTRRVRNAWLVTEAALVFIIGWLLCRPDAAQRGAPSRRTCRLGS